MSTIREKRNSVAKVLSRFKDKAGTLGGKIRSAPHRIKSGIKTGSNIRSLMSKYGISTSFGSKNYNTIFRHTSSLFDKGKAREARQYLQQQSKGTKGTKIKK